MGGAICPECQTGKHSNCNGEGAYSEEFDQIIHCQCHEGIHSPASYARRDILLKEIRAIQKRRKSDAYGIVEEDFVTEPEMLSIFQEAPQPVPEEDPSVRADAFPEFEEESGLVTVGKLRGQVGVIRDLYDVEVQNPKGEWVPVVPMPIFLGFGLVECMCKKRRFGKKRYQEHYAYAHILGMEA